MRVHGVSSRHVVAWGRCPVWSRAVDCVVSSTWSGNLATIELIALMAVAVVVGWVGSSAGSQLGPGQSCLHHNCDAAELGSGHVMNTHVFFETIGLPCLMCIFDLTCGAAFAVDHDIPGLTYPHDHHT